jgi:DNA topoisomerase-1
MPFMPSPAAGDNRSGRAANNAPRRGAMAAAFDPRAVPPILQAPPPLCVPARTLPPPQAAEIAGLRYVSDLEPGIQRRPCGSGFVFMGADGKRIRDREKLQRIRLLAIPPAWQKVWICPSEHGHVQATGRDARGRKQYIYHSDWIAVRDANKFARMRAFGKALPAIRRRVAADLALPGIPKQKVLATLVRLLDASLIRIGNEQYARSNGSYGLTTLRSRHVDVTGAVIQFHFRGKGGMLHRIVVTEPKLARVIRRLLDLPGQELFRYADDNGDLHPVDSGDVNEYLRTIGGDDFTAKDFRTWYATHTALQGLEKREVLSKAQARSEVKRVLCEVAQKLGNTPTICRKSYVHPVVIESYLAGELGCDSAAPRSPTQRLFRLLAKRRRRSGAQAQPAAKVH